MDRKSQHNTTEKNFNVKGSAEQIEAARRIICDKIGMQIKVVGGSGGSGGGGGGGYGGGSAGGGSNPYAQQWGATGASAQYGQWGAGAESQLQQQSAAAAAAGGGGADYSAQWIEYYRAMGMTREAEIIEQQLKTKQSTGGPQPGMGAPTGGMPQQAAQQAPNGGVAGGQSNDYSAQWAEYYRAMGKIDEAEAIEKSMGAGKVGGAGVFVLSQFIND